MLWAGGAGIAGTLDALDSCSPGWPGSLVDLTSLETVFIVIVILAVAILLRVPNIVRPYCDTNKKLIADSQAFDLHIESKSYSELIMFLLRCSGKGKGKG